MPKTKPSPSPSSSEVHPALRRVFQARNEFDRLLHLTTLLKEAHFDLPDFFESTTVLTHVCREPDPNKLAWMLAQEIRRRTGGRLPPALEPYADRPDLALAQQAEDEARFRHGMEEWLSQEPDASIPKRELRVIWRRQAGADPFSGRITIELRLNSAKLKEGSRNFFQVRGLCNELAHSPEIFRPEDALLLRWLNDYHSILLTDKNRNGNPFVTDPRTLLIWLQHWGGSNRCVWEPDQSSVGFDSTAVRLVPSLQENANNDQGTSVELGFEALIGTSRRVPLHDVWLFLASKSEVSRLDPELILVGNKFHRLVERPPQSLLELVQRQGPVRMKPNQVQALLPKLLRRFPALQPQVRIRLREVPVQVRFFFTLDEEDWLHIRLQASARQGGDTWEWNLGGWQHLAKRSEAQRSEVPSVAFEALDPTTIAQDAPVGTPFSTPGELWDVIPAERDVTDAIAWLEQWGGQDGESAGRPDSTGWWLTVNGRRLAALLPLWKDRRTIWSCFGNKRFHKLILGQRRVFPKIKVQSCGVDWFSVRAEWEDESLRITPEQWAQFQASDEPFVKIGDGDWVAREELQELHQAAATLAELGVALQPGEQMVQTRQLVNAEHAAWDQLKEGGTVPWATELQRLREAVAHMTDWPPVSQPAGVLAELRPYQEEGLRFLAHSSRLKMGAILADDMGLGKTLQALSWLEHLRETHGPKPSLVVCPASVVFNWQRESKQFVPGQRVLVLSAGGERHGLREQIPKYDLIVTNYALLRRDLASLKKFEFRAVILDEAQNIKNPDSMVARAAKELRGEHRLALTGTPLENRLLDLWSLVDFVQPGYLVPRSDFLQHYDRGTLPNARALLTARLRPLMLRRLKTQVAKDLPDRIEERIDCEMGEAQRRFYLAELQRSRQMLQEMDSSTGLVKNRIHVLAALTRLRQICCHPALAGGKKTIGSGKTDALIELLEPLRAEGHKVLIFSQFVEMLKLLQADFESRGIPYYLLTGQTTNREEVVHSFQNDPQPCVFLLSLKAAGTGLNLTSASYVVLYDPWWNPAVEAQAIDRTHRLGQDRTVIAYRLVTLGTIEEKIWELQQRKGRMVREVLGEDGFSGTLTPADLEYLLQEPTEAAGVLGVT